MSRFRIYPTAAQQTALLKQCGHARYVWNLAVEQWGMWSPDRGLTPGYTEKCRQLTEARAEFAWLRAGSQTVQQQALRDFDHALRNYYGGTHGRPTWRRAGRHEGFQIVGHQASRVVKLNRKWAAANVPKVGWVRFRLSRALPEAKSYRVTYRAGCWHAQVFDADDVESPREVSAGPQLPRPGGDPSSSVEFGDRIAQMTKRSKPRPGPERPGAYLANGGRAKTGLNRGILTNGWGHLVRRLEDKAPGRVEKIDPAFTSQTCSVCGYRASENRKSQAVFQCAACGPQANADVNAAVNIAAGRAVSVRRETPVPVSLKREPQLATSA